MARRRMTKAEREAYEETKAEINFARNQLAAALNATSIIQVVNRAATQTQASVLCRVKEEELFMQLIWYLLSQEQEADGKWSIFIAQQYFLDENQELRFGWHISLTSQNIAWAISQIRKLIELVSSSLGIQFRLESMPLPHITAADRNQPNEKGGGVVGTTDGLIPAILRSGR